MIWAAILLRLKSALGAVLSAFKRWPRECAILVLLCACVWLWKGWDHADQRAEDCKRASAATVAALKAEKAATEARHAQITKETDHATEPNRRTALAGLEHYADAHRVCHDSNRTSEVGGSVPVPAPVAAGTEAGRESTAVVVPKPALEACTANSADLQTAVEWARKVWP